MKAKGGGWWWQWGPSPPWCPPLTCPAGQAAALSRHRLAAVGVGAVAALPAVHPKCPVLGYRDGVGGSGGGGQHRAGGQWHQTPVRAAPTQAGGLTGQGCRQRGPRQPGGQAQVPLWGSQVAPWAQSQLRLQPGPQVPSGHGVEQSGPCQPAG